MKKRWTIINELDEKQIYRLNHMQESIVKYNKQIYIKYDNTIKYIYTIQVQDHLQTPLQDDSCFIPSLDPSLIFRFSLTLPGGSPYWIFFCLLWLPCHLTCRYRTTTTTTQNFYQIKIHDCCVRSIPQSLISCNCLEFDKLQLHRV